MTGDEPLDVVKAGPPRAGGADHARSAGSVVLNLVPLAGGSIAELLSAVFTSPLERRRERFLRALADVVTDLVERGLTVEQLSDDEAFITACNDAAQIAMGEHLEEKIEMLKACLVHQALPHELSDLVALRYLSWVDDLEPQHITVLRYASSPAESYDERSIHRDQLAGPRREALNRAQLGVPADQLEFVLTDLADRRLADVGMLSGMVTARSFYDPWITGRGREFLQWITLV